MPPGSGTSRARDAQSASRNAALEGVRGAGALAVFGFHAWLYTRADVRAVVGGRGLDDQLLSQLRVGLVLFFVLSGFLLYGPWVRARLDGSPAPRIGAYARRRAARILPGYYVAIGVSALVLWRLADTPGVRLPPVAKLPLFLVFAQNQSADTVVRLDPPTWTLAIEASFYVVLPLLAWAALRPRSARLGLLGVPLAMVVAGVATNWVLSRDPTPTQTLSKSLPAMLPYFAFGMLAAVLTHGRRVGARAASLLLVAGGALIVANAVLHAVADPGSDLALRLRVSRDALAAIGFAVIIAVATMRPPRGLTWRPLTFVGEVSYGVFLWHVPVFLVLRGTGLLPLHVLPAAAIALPISVGLGWLSWRFLERPAMAWAAR